VEVSLSQESKGAYLKEGVGGDVMEAKPVEHHKLAEEFRSLHRETSLDVRGEENEFSLARGRYPLFSGGAPEFLFLFGQLADGVKCLEIQDHDVEALSVGGHPMSSGPRSSGDAGVADLSHVLRERGRMVAAEGARGWPYVRERKNMGMAMENLGRVSMRKMELKGIRSFL
jgi:hypothetical protein